MRNAAWLIESSIHDSRGVFYLCAKKLGKWDLRWLPEPQAALQFARKEDAEKMIEVVREFAPDLFPSCVPMPQVTEHIFDSGVADAA